VINSENQQNQKLNKAKSKKQLTRDLICKKKTIEMRQIKIRESSGLKEKYYILG
jgi:hypothetical protein